MKDTISYIWQLLTAAFWSGWISKAVVFCSLLSSITGYTLKELFNNSTFARSINPVYFLVFSMVIIILRLLWVSGKILKETSFTKSIRYTPVKMTKHVREMVQVCNELINGHKTQSDVLAYICNKLRDCTDKLTDTRCCVSIKLIEGDNDGTYLMDIDKISNQKVMNVARDNNHRSRDTEEYNQAEHYIRENTAYATIVGGLRKNRRFYLNNDVNLGNSYMTTSPYGEDDDSTPVIPYKSELVFPIMKTSGNKYSFVGFLCIDSDSTDAFRKDNEIVEICSMLADSLYWIFTKYGPK